MTANRPTLPAVASFEPRYHEQAVRQGQPIWVPSYNPYRACVAEERLRLEQDGALVESQLSKLPVSVRRAARRTRRAQRFSRIKPALESVNSVFILAVTTHVVLLLCSIVGGILMNLANPNWFQSLEPVSKLAIAIGAGMPLVGTGVGVLCWSWMSAARRG